MIVKVPFLVVSGYCIFDVDVKKLDEARDLIRNSQAKQLATNFEDIKLNFDAMCEHEAPKPEAAIRSNAIGDPTGSIGNPENLDPYAEEASCWRIDISASV